MNLKNVAHLFLLHRFRTKYPHTKLVGSFVAPLERGIYSQSGQDCFLASHLLSSIESGIIPRTFLDVGCNHPTLFSNSYFFERFLNFQCIAVDPLETYVDEWKNLRPTAIHKTVALGNSTQDVVLYVPEPDARAGEHPIDMFSTLVPDKKNPKANGCVKVTVHMTRGAELLRELDMQEVGLASIDVEGHELDVLKGIDLERNTVHVAVIENNKRSRYGSDVIRKYMSDCGFEFFARIYGMDDIFLNRKTLGHLLQGR